MSQRINLYIAEKKRFKLEFTFKDACRVLGVFSSILLMITTVDVVKHLHIKKEFNVLDKEQQEKTSKLQNISGKIPQEQDRDQILAHIKTLEADKSSKLEILSLLAGAQSSKNSGFGSYFESLAKGAVPGLWITSFSFKDSGSTLSFHGRTLKPEFVPKLISALGADPIYSGRTFDAFRISMDEKTKELSFVLQTNTEDKP